MGAQTVLCIAHEALAVPRTDIHARVLADLVIEREPWLVLMALNDFGREIAAFCAQRCSAGLIADCDELVAQRGSGGGALPRPGAVTSWPILHWPPAGPALLSLFSPTGVELPPHDAAQGEIEKIVPKQS